MPLFSWKKISGALLAPRQFHLQPYCPCDQEVCVLVDAFGNVILDAFGNAILCP